MSERAGGNISVQSERNQTSTMLNYKSQGSCQRAHVSLLTNAQRAQPKLNNKIIKSQIR